MKKIVIGNDHTAVEMKNYLWEYLQSNGYEIINVGVDNNDAVDYPDIGAQVGKVIANKEAERGIIICGTGIGISIAANKVKGVRAALCYEEETARLAREHNDANILALGARIIAKEKAVSLLKVFLETDFLGDRHEKRVEKLNNL